jgi:hypothetical protein
MRRLILPGIVIACILLTAGSVRAQSRESAAPSARKVNEAIQDIQEKTRRFYMDVGIVLGGAARVSRTCDERSGEVCFGGQRECHGCVPWPKDYPIHSLAARYDSLALLIARAPRDANAELLQWFHGQRVGLWARTGALGRARTAAVECTADAWWCEALVAFVDDMEGRYIESEAHFRNVLETMPRNLACYWNEIALYIDTMASSVGHSGPDRGCRTLDDNAAFWTLADPLFSVPGNERLTAHYARHVDMHIHRQYLDAIGGNHPIQHHTVVLRHGWPTGYIGHRSEMTLVYGRGQDFIVTVPIEQALQGSARMFEPDSSRARETAPASVGRITALPIQAGFFRRDGQPGLLLRSRAPAAARPLRWLLHSWTATAWQHLDVASSADTLIAWLPTPWTPQLLSLEAVAPPGGYRARTGTVPPDSSRITLSSAVLIDGDEEATSLADAARRMRTSTLIPRDSLVSIYWETYLPSEVTASIEVTTGSLTPPGLIRRIIGRTPSAVRVAWQETFTPVNGAAPKSVALDLSRLPKGDHEIVVTVTLPGGRQLRTSLTVTADPART